jgi:hypothetical protein
MRVDLVCAGACQDDGLPTQIAGCGIIIRLIDDHDRVQSREFGWALGGSTANLADVQAVRLALSSVLPQFRGYPTILYVNSNYVFNLLEKENKHTFKATSKKNKSEIEEMRRWFGYYKSISMVKYNQHADMDVEILTRTIQLAQDALESQQHHDSGTIGLDA